MPHLASEQEAGVGEAHIAAEEIEEAAGEIQEEVEEAHEQAVSGDVAGAEARLRQLEDRLSSLEAASTALRQGIEGRAPMGHDHPLPGHLQTVSDALAEVESEERAPNRQGFFHRKLFGGRD